MLEKIAGFFFLFILSQQVFIGAITKVVVPSIYKEFEGKELPDWLTNDATKSKYGYETFLYQRTDPSAPNYVRNRGTEGSVYLRYIIDHYDSFPDYAIFVHAFPEGHSPDWLELISCLRPTATYININFQYYNRSPLMWPSLAIWLEQCWRDVLQITWNVTKEELVRRVPVDKPLQVSLSCCQQFVVSRELIRKRSLDTWKQLYHIMNTQDVCHEGEPDYEHNYAYLHVNREKVGPEPKDIITYTYGKGKRFNGDAPGQGYGKHIQGVTTEYLSHVIFGHLELEWPEPSNELLCQQFHPNNHPGCSHSPCKASSSVENTKAQVAESNIHSLPRPHNPRQAIHNPRPPHNLQNNNNRINNNHRNIHT